MNQLDLTDRILGGLLGVHAGDSFGASFEFRSWADINRNFPPGQRKTDITGGGPFGWFPGQATDDTDLTKAVLDAYLQPDGFSLRQAADNMLAWYDANPPDVGNATASGLDRYRTTNDPANAGAGAGSCGNGSLMRCISTGLVRINPDARRQESVAISAVTHNDPLCTTACGVYNEIVAALLDGTTAAEAVVQALALPAAIYGTQTLDAVLTGTELDIHDMAVNGPDPDLIWNPAGGFVLLSLALAVAAVLDQRPYQDIIIDIAHFGGDTDTNAAIAGGLVGVRDGADSLPSEWVDLLQFRDHFTRGAAALTTIRENP